MSTVDNPTYASTSTCSGGAGFRMDAAECLQERRSIPDCKYMGGCNLEGAYLGGLHSGDPAGLGVPSVQAALCISHDDKVAPCSNGGGDALR